MNILITICARGGSKGVPGKNTKILAGKPLIAHTINIAKKVLNIYKPTIAISSDSDEIIKISEGSGLNINMYKRPQNLATDESAKVPVINDVLLYYEKIKNKKFDFILDLDVTSPLRTKLDIEDSFKIFLNKSKALTLFSVSPANRNPYFNMVEKKENNFFNLIKIPKKMIFSRQRAPRVYDLNASFYWFRREFFNGKDKSQITEKSLIYEVNHICFDIDNSIDFDFLEFLIEKNKINDLI
jgi:CMP-N,N'-diacetyllegionaminic acid synthase